MQLFYPLGNPSKNIGIHKYLDTTKNHSYIPITGCILSHILSSKELSSLEKMYYILADSLSCINFNKGRNRSISLPAKSWAERLSCSKSEVFVLQKSLEDKGYFLIHRDKNDKGQNNRNIITTTIPDKVFNDLKYEPDRFNLCDINDATTHQNNSNSLDYIDKAFIPTLEGKRQHLEKTKMFIRVPYEFLKQLNSNCSISATSKVIMLYFFTKIYKSAYHKYDYDDVLTHNPYSFITSYQELQKDLKLHRNSLSKALETLEDNNLISKQRFFIKDTADYNSRADKLLWQISLLNSSLTTNPNYQQEQNDQEEHVGQQQTVISDQTKAEYNNNKVLASSQEWECTKYDPPCTDSGQLYNKDFVIKNSIIENIDYIDANHLNLKNLSINNSSANLQSKEDVKKEFLGNEICSLPSESHNNSFEESIGAKLSCSNIPPEAVIRIIKNISENRELRHFYPLSAKDVDMLNFRANRGFSINFVNQLLLKLYIKYPEKRFKNKFTFLSYMEKILKNEKHQGPLVNHTTFRFNCNINTDEKNLLEYEKNLSEIENSLDTSKEMQVKKKIAGRFSTEIAYKILTQVEFKTNYENSFITVLIPNNLDLSERQIEILSEQLEAVYGINGYYVQELEDVGYAKDAIAIDTKTGIQTFSKIPKEEPLNSIPSTSAWHKIRKGLIEELGAAIDAVWFSKATVREYQETSTLTLTMPTRFMVDWVRNNYSHVIRRLASGCKMVEYVYE
ncbi:chromosomal replication initiator DnaA (plasmid) [Rickettsia amblyommatis]|uniref:DnaA-like protein n=2 Tax=Rickettsia amblyommatis TaxID=33989 RepID=H8K6D7_RICAG|nr:DnaA N-terminal domain-containing protein [Rickettsia amblyommatis]ADD14601.1 DnaA-like protein [Rickettsia amblyommatis str. AaR/SC]AFC70448.1 DnaA-like protein [Rickettsia amblyommatis str. GAT-30V]ARD88238.1 chromosomal replication initiator DnaA [Rickettsia amblyommatis]